MDITSGVPIITNNNTGWILIICWALCLVFCIDYLLNPDTSITTFPERETEALRSEYTLRERIINQNNTR